MVYYTVPLFFSIFLEFLMIADIITTETGLKLGLTETNPLWSIWLIIFKLLFPLLFYAFYMYVTKPLNGVHLQACFITYILVNLFLCVFYTVILINNVTLILSR